MAKVTNIEVVRKKKRRKRFFKRLILFVMAVLLVFGIFIFNDQIAGLDIDIEGLLNDGLSLAKKGSGFPQQLSGTEVKKISRMGNDLVVLTDTNLTIYSNSANKITDIQHGYADADISIGNKNILLYDRGGNSFSVYSRSRQLFTKKTEYPIVQAQISPKGQVAYATSSDKYSSSITLLDSHFAEKLTWSTPQYVTSIAFTANEAQMAVSTMYTKSGIVNSSVYHIDIKQSNEVYHMDFADVMLMQVLYNNKNEITAIGDNCSVHLSYDGKSVLSKVEYTPSQLMGFRTGENGLALLFNQIGQLSEKEAVFYDSALNEKARSVITGPIRSIEYNGDELVILSQEAVYVYSGDGRLLHKIEAEGEFTKAIGIKKALYVVSLDDIRKIDYPK